ncbi:MAG: hypothetical protein HOC20_02915 [Chloroflexi bacterium]|jgi:hypothetical protein|nr:hypothetical protein [Chloroflexota bacterium]
MKKISVRVIVVGLIVCICAGIGIGYAIKDSQARALDLENSELEDRIAVHDSTVEQLQEQVAELNTNLEAKRSELNSLGVEYSGISGSLTAVQESLSILEENYQELDANYQKSVEAEAKLRDACGSATVDEILRLRDELEKSKELNAAVDYDKRWLEVEIAILNKKMERSPDNALDREEVFNNTETYSSPAWKGDDFGLQQKLEEIAQSYYNTHTYYEGETDCNDMAADLWNMLLTEDIKSVIVVGDRGQVGESFEESKHAWLYVFNGDGKVIYLEPTDGDVFYGLLPNGNANPKAGAYREALYIYEKPSDLRMDLKAWW